jgi:GNAT superfamily N-acetyltransferase
MKEEQHGMGHKGLDESVPQVGQFDIAAEDVDSADATRLIAELSAELARRYNFADDGSGHFHPEDVAVPRSVFLLSRLNGRAVACGALRSLEGDVAELKLMYVESAVRGRGLSKRLLTALEDFARNMGYVALRLETADRQPEAIGLYQSAGYHRIEPFGSYVSDERSV